jgi:hypothetical protein
VLDHVAHQIAHGHVQVLVGVISVSDTEGVGRPMSRLKS